MKRNSKGKQEMTETTAEDRSAELLPETTEIIMRLTGEISEHLFNNLADFARHLATAATDAQRKALTAYLEEATNRATPNGQPGLAMPLDEVLEAQAKGIVEYYVGRAVNLHWLGIFCFAIHACRVLEIRQTTPTFNYLITDSDGATGLIEELKPEDYAWLNEQFVNAGYHSLEKIFGVRAPE